MKKIKILCLCLLLVCLASCTKTKQYVIPNATITEISHLLNEFAGINGFRITYAHETDTRLSYRVYIGTTSRIMPGETETIYEGDFSENKQSQKDANGDTLKTRENTSYSTVRTTQRPPEEVITNWNFSIQLTQYNKDVLVYAKASGGFNPTKYVKDFINLLEFHGFIASKLKE